MTHVSDDFLVRRQLRWTSGTYWRACRASISLTAAAVLGRRCARGQDHKDTQPRP